MQTSTEKQTERISELTSHLAKGLIGHDRLIKRLLIALFTGGHLLLEGPPGLAKTRAVKLLSSALEGSFARIQCTPDLMPADLTGVPVFMPSTGAFQFTPGPVFHNLVLVDEINRAPPKVQSALLEAMAEHQVTIGNETHPLPDPFLVVATQNPIEHDGTFPLPEAQLDRFMLHIQLALPDAQTERQILDLVESEAESGGPQELILSRTDLDFARKATKSVHVSSELRDYIVRLVMATRSGEAAADVDHAVSPRGSLALAAAAKASAFLDGRDFAVPKDVSDVAQDALAHRLVLTWRAVADGRTARDVIAQILRTVEPL